MTTPPEAMLTEPVTCSSCGAVSINGGTIHCHRCFTDAQQGVGEANTRPHGFDADRCPTFYDGCNCTVEALVHNINRAEKAEAERDRFKAEAERLEEKFAVASLFVKGALEQKIQAEAERDEARAEVVRLKEEVFKLTDERRQAVEALHPHSATLFCRNQNLERKADALREQVRELAEALENLLPCVEPYTRDISGIHTLRPQVEAAHAALDKVKNEG